MIDVLIITFNESANLPHCLASLKGWVERVMVVDSGSDDGTVEVAKQHGAEVAHHDWPGYAHQRNWALDNLDLTSPWTLVLDADEVITPALRDEIIMITKRLVEDVPENGFFINRLTYFLDEPIRHCGYFPSWNLRLFRRGMGRYEDRLVHEHVILPNPVGYIDEPMLHHDRRGLEHFYAKHNRYSTLEAQQLFQEVLDPSLRHVGEANVSSDTRRRRWLKRHVTRWTPLPALWRFLYMYVFRMGFLDGRIGYRFCRFIASYDGMVAFKLRTLLHQYHLNKGGDQLGAGVAALARHEGCGLGTHVTPANQDTLPPSRRWDHSDAPTREEGQAEDHQDSPHQMQPESSPWSFRGKLARAVWMLVGKPLFRCSFHNWYAYRRLVLRLFGAKIGKDVVIRPSVNIEIPWMLDIDDEATVGDHAILYSLGMITIGKRVIISQYAHLCAGTHDYTDRRFKLLRTPITLGDDAWIGADAFIGPEVTVGPLSVIGARSSVYKSVPSGKVVAGNPAKVIKDRELR